MGLSAYIDQLSAKLSCTSARRSAIRELSSLDDRQLNEIGLYRGAIVAEVDSQLYRCSGQGARADPLAGRAPPLES